MKSVEDLLPVSRCLLSVYRLEHLAAAGGLASNVSRQIEMNGIKLHPLKSTLHGAQLVSRGLMEHDELVFGGVAYVRM